TVRRLALAAAVRLPGFATAALRNVSPRLRAGPLVRRRLLLDPLPGTLCPQPWVNVDGVRRRLDDVLGEGFAVVSAGAPHPALASLARRLYAPVLPVRRGDPLATWLRRGHAGAALLRPDRVVLATARRRRGLPGADLARAAPTWLHLVAA
ncbi:MAG: hypothetical protein ACRDT4_27520, partial [Micromonosporaceae bacterium]